VDPEVDYEYLADRTEGFSGADIASICKAAAKTAIRRSIADERRKFEESEQRRREAEEKNETYVEPPPSDDDEIPFITKAMLMSALATSRRSVTKQDLERYMKYKRDMERRLGMEEGGGEVQMGPVVGLDAEQRGRPQSSAPPTSSGSQPPAARSFADAGTNEDDDIYE